MTPAWPHGVARNVMARDYRWRIRCRKAAQEVSDRALPAGSAIDSKAQVEQVRSIDVERLRHRVGVASDAVMRDVDRALRAHLSL